MNSGLISFKIDWFDLLGVQGTLKSLLQHYRSKASILQCSAFFMAQLSLTTQTSLIHCLGFNTMVRMAFIKKSTNKNAEEDIEKREPSCTVGRNVNWYSHYGEQYGDSLKKKKLGINLPSDPTIPLLEYTLIKSQFQKTHVGEFPGGVVVKTWSFNCRGHKFNPWLGN